MDSPIIHLKDSAIAAAHKQQQQVEENVATISDMSPELFEFSSDFGSVMSDADDIIFGGKLIPLGDRNKLGSCSDLRHPEMDDKFHRQRRSGSLSERSRPSRSNRTIMRTSRSLDYQKLYGSSSVIERNTSVKSLGKEKPAPAKPRWHFFIFGLVQLPSEMELQDIKNRQGRRSKGTMTEKNYDPLNTDDRKRITWNILRLLSCKDDRSVPVMEPAFSRLQQV